MAKDAYLVIHQKSQVIKSCLADAGNRSPDVYQ